LNENINARESLWCRRVDQLCPSGIPYLAQNFVTVFIAATH